MSRPLRFEYPGAWYHVMNRGAGSNKIYNNDIHREFFLELCAEAVSQFKIEIHSYCLMSNHYHLLIKTPQGNLGRAMKHINGLYTQQYNRSEKTDGPLFRGRYKAILVDGDPYLLQVTRYIHLNPVEAKIVTLPENYRWSSYKYYTQVLQKPSWLKTNMILNMFSELNQIQNYKKFVMDGVDNKTHSFYSQKNIPAYFGVAWGQTPGQILPGV